jgi:hypothetical protein
LPETRTWSRAAFEDAADMVAPIVAAVHWDLFPCTHIVLTLAIDSTSRLLEGKLQIRRG